MRHRVISTRVLERQIQIRSGSPGRGSILSSRLALCISQERYLSWKPNIDWMMRRGGPKWLGRPIGPPGRVQSPRYIRQTWATTDFAKYGVVFAEDSNMLFIRMRVSKQVQNSVFFRDGVFPKGVVSHRSG